MFSSPIIKVDYNIIINNELIIIDIKKAPNKYKSSQYKNTHVLMEFEFLNDYFFIYNFNLIKIKKTSSYFILKNKAEQIAYTIIINPIENRLFELLIYKDELSNYPIDLEQLKGVCLNNIEDVVEIICYNRSFDKYCSVYNNKIHDNIKQEMLYDNSEVTSIMDDKMLKILRCVVRDYSVVSPEQMLISEDENKKYKLFIMPLKKSNINEEYWLVIKKDITSEFKLENRFSHLAFYDQITGLPNRHKFILELEKLSEATKINSHGIFLININNFKSINDTMGHSCGDILLKQFSARLRQVFKLNGSAFRLSGDEFIVLIQGLPQEKEKIIQYLVYCANSLLKNIEKPFEINNILQTITISIGITVLRDKNEQQVLLEADLALDRAKSKLVNSYEIYADHMKEKAINDKITLMKLKNNIEKNKELDIFLQGQFKDNKIIGAEGLIRWVTEGNKVIHPSEFLPQAIHFGEIDKVDFFMLKQACIVLSDWEKFEFTKNLSLSVNITSRTFVRDDFIGILSDILELYNIKNNKLKMEITENLFLDNTPGVLNKMEALKTMGVGISLDDFGTGYSSLSYLCQFPIGEIKIDKQFVKNAIINKKEGAIIETIIDLGKKLDLTILAEGVESNIQKEFLINKGCFIHQGFYYSKPIDRNAFMKFLLETNH